MLRDAHRPPGVHGALVIWAILLSAWFLYLVLAEIRNELRKANQRAERDRMFRR